MESARSAILPLGLIRVEALPKAVLVQRRGCIGTMTIAVLGAPRRIGTAAINAAQKVAELSPLWSENDKHFWYTTHLCLKEAKISLLIIGISRYRISPQCFTRRPSEHIDMICVWDEYCTKQYSALAEPCALSLCSPLRCDA